MSAYMIATINVTDPDRFKDYAAAAGKVTAQFGGQYIVRGGDKSLLEGDLTGNRVVVIKFADRETAEAWYNSPEYRHAKSLREGAATGTFVAVDGV